MARSVSVPFAVVALVVAAIALTGCGADRHLQRQASAARATTCQSIIERQDRRAGPPIAPTRWLDEVAKPPKSLHETINEREIIDDCLEVEAKMLSGANQRSENLRLFGGGGTSGEGTAPGAASLLQKLAGVTPHP